MKTTAIALTAALGASTAFAGGVPGLDAELVAQGFNRPVGVYTAPGDDANRLFVIEKRGQIRIIENGSILPTPFLNIDSIVGGSNQIFDERGLLGLAFHPDYENNGTFFVNYNNNGGTTVIAKYQRQSANIANPAGDIILTYSQPFSNHNGGWMEFSPRDRYLYIGSGDGGSGNDPQGNAQRTVNELLGKILRIDVDGDDFPSDPNRDYAIPADNPFVGMAGDDEIWAWGLRNPWRNAFDSMTGDLFIADVGQGAREEINFVPPRSEGGNFGWRCLEGTRTTGLSGCSPSDPSLIAPIWEYPRNLGISVTGGRIYRGCAIEGLDGYYFFADYGSSRIWAGRVAANGTQFEGGAPVQVQTDLQTVGSIFNIASFGEDANGEILIVSQSGGRIFRIVPQGGIVDMDDNGIADSCEASICLGDCDMSGDVNFADLVAMLFVFGDSTPACDADESGTVNFADLVAALFAFGPCP